MCVQCRTVVAVCVTPRGLRFFRGCVSVLLPINQYCAHLTHLVLPQVRATVGHNAVTTTTVHKYFGNQWGVLVAFAPRVSAETSCVRSVLANAKL